MSPPAMNNLLIKMASLTKLVRLSANPGVLWSRALSTETRDSYDLVIVGGGMVGLALATSVGKSKKKISNFFFL